MANNLQLTFASNEDSLSVRRFTVTEQLSGLFVIDIVARSEVVDLDLETLVGHGASFAVLGDTKFVLGGDAASASQRAWTGVCSHVEQLQAEETGLSTYALRILPSLWRTTLRTNIRIFQRLSVPDLVKKLLLEWDIEPELRLTGTYPKHEYRVQYMETDFVFISRMLEEAGITYFFEFGTVEDGPSKAKLILSDAPQSADASIGPLPFVEGMTSEGRRDFITKVRLSTEVRPGAFTMRDHDFRLKTDYQLIQQHKVGIDRELSLERYEYQPGSYWVESQGTKLPTADDKGLFKADETHGKQRATLALEAERAGRRTVRFETNVIAVAPGKVFTVSGHQRKELGADKKLLATRSVLRGNHDGNYEFVGEAVFTEDAYRPARVTPRPRIYGVQSAVVVGPAGQEIHTDEFGRVRLQFHWDRENAFSDESSCWIRVSQGWAGLGYGMINIPRVGQEVLVEFFDGDPDRPVITGRVYNNTSRVPYKLPENKTKSGWKSDSSPGSDGFNELMFEDKKGAEIVHIQAQRDFTEVIKNNQSSTVLNGRSASVTSSDSLTVGASVSVAAGQGISWTAGKTISADAGEMHSVHVASGTGTDITDKRIVSSTGGASITLDGDNIILEAKGTLVIRSGGLAQFHSQAEIQIDAPMTYINSFSASAPAVPTIPAANPPGGPGSGGETNDSTYKPEGRGEVAPPGGYDEAMPNAFVANPPATTAAAPAALSIDPAAALSIARDVASGNPITALSNANVRALLPPQVGSAIDKGLQLVNVARTFKETKGLSLLEIPELKQAVAGIATQPIIGSVSAVDIADVLNAGTRFGVWHVDGPVGDAAAFLRAAAPDAPNRVDAAIAEVQAKIPPGVTQLLGLKTESAPARIDGAMLTRDVETAASQGQPPILAQATALAQQGVALYRGDFAGQFTRILGGG